MNDLNFPLVDKQGKLYDRFPLIILHLSGGEKVQLNYFTEYAGGYIPTRYMDNNVDNFMPTIKYHSYFISPIDTYKEFLRHSSDKMKKDKMNSLQVSSNVFVNMECVTKVEIDMQHGDIICFGQVQWINESKRPLVNFNDITVANIRDIDVIDSDETIMKRVDGKKEVEDFFKELIK